MTASSLLGIDVGGTTIKSRLVDEHGRALGEWRRETPREDDSGRATVDLIEELLAEARAVSPVGGLGVVVPGIVDESAGVCVLAVNLGWQNLDIAGRLRDRLDVPLAFGQDVRAGALAEGISGAAAGHPGPFAFVPIGTGLASAIGTGGVIASRQEWPGEIGQELITQGRYAGRRVEEIASASGIARTAGAPDARTVADRVRAGDPAAIEVWDDAVDVLGDAIASIAHRALASLVVVGGGLAEAGSLLLIPLSGAIATRLPEGTVVELRPAAHGDSAAIVGAIELARSLVATP